MSEDNHIRLEKWNTIYIVDDINPYMAPELYPIRMNGKVYGHHRFDDGTVVTTSHVVKFDQEKCLVVTRSGSVYLLGEPNPEFVRWCEKYPKANIALAKIIGLEN